MGCKVVTTAGWTDGQTSQGTTISYGSNGPRVKIKHENHDLKSSSSRYENECMKTMQLIKCILIYLLCSRILIPRIFPLYSLIHAQSIMNLLFNWLRLGPLILTCINFIQCNWYYEFVWQYISDNKSVGVAHLNSGQGPVSLMFFPSQLKFNGNFVALHLNSNTVIATNFFTWHDSCAVVACAKICCDLMASNRVKARRSCNRIWIAGKKMLVIQASTTQSIYWKWWRLISI